jgi:omega-hydroxy-beta-dihydromenaquinone-9 sulfotransferase
MWDTLLIWEGARGFTCHNQAESRSSKHLSTENTRMQSQLLRLGYQIGLLGFTRFSNVLALAPRILTIEAQYLPRVLLVILLSLLSMPLRLLETLIWGRILSGTFINEKPIFILGHWRSGTTLLHNLLIQDTSFGFMSMYQGIAPECCLVGGSWLSEILSRMIPEKRPMDNVKWPLDSPQEEEIALSKMLPFAFYISTLFPKDSTRALVEAIDFEGTRQHRGSAFEIAYSKLLSIATLRAKGKPLALKNPVNSGRIKILLKLFPKAQFIHIVRNPYAVYSSTMGLHKSLIDITRLQAPNESVARDATLENYKTLMLCYLRDRDLIPQGQLAEVRFEDLEREPLKQIEKIYQTLGLQGFKSAEPRFKQYIKQEQDYVKNQAQISAEEQRLVSEEWGLSFAAFGYEFMQ